MAVVSKTDISKKNTNIFRICLENESKRMINSDLSEYIPRSQRTLVKYNLR